jgi:hypothetical protein
MRLFPLAPCGGKSWGKNENLSPFLGGGFKKIFEDSKEIQLLSDPKYLAHFLRATIMLPLLSRGLRPFENGHKKYPCSDGEAKNSY